MTTVARASRLRKGRVSEPGRIYLITIVCHQRNCVFADIHAGRCVVHAMRRVAVSASTLCYVVMPDHVHWLAQMNDVLSLSRSVQALKSDVTRQLRMRDPGLGPLWMKGFHDHALRREEDIVATARYVVANPLRAGLVEKLADYPLWDAVWI
jgi:putative transposase